MKSSMAGGLTTLATIIIIILGVIGGIYVGVTQYQDYIRHHHLLEVGEVVDLSSNQVIKSRIRFVKNQKCLVLSLTPDKARSIGQLKQLRPGDMAAVTLDGEIIGDLKLEKDLDENNIPIPMKSYDAFRIANALGR